MWYEQQEIPLTMEEIEKNRRITIVGHYRGNMDESSWPHG
jgi:hypothetical protein